MQKHIKIASYNIQYGKGKDNIINIRRIADEVAEADIIALQEIDRFWSRSGNTDQLAELQSYFPEYYCLFGAGVDIVHPDNRPDFPKRRQFGNALFSRYPFEINWHWLLPKEGGGDALSIQRSAVEAQIRLGNTPIRFTSVHLTHLNSDCRRSQVEFLSRRQQQAVACGYVVGGNLDGMDWQTDINNQQITQSAIWLGDFNCQPDSKEYCQIAGTLSDYGGRVRATNGFIDAWTHTGHDLMHGHTSDVRGLPARIDYAFLTADLTHAVTDFYVDNTAIGSDHQPIWLVLDTKLL